MPHARAITLASRPQGQPVPGNFALKDIDLPAPGPGQFAVRIVWLSLDPYMRGRMDDAKSYAAPVEVGGVMEGGAVGEVTESQNPRFPVGSIVTGPFGWATHAVSDGTGVRVVDPAMAPIATALGVLGMPGITAWVGLTDIPQAKAGQTIVVSAATGAVGSLAGQLAKARGCRVVGVAGGADKCAFAVEALGLDACLDHRAHDVASLAAALKSAAPDGIDGYFENVGGKTTEAVLTRMNTHGRIALCGMIAWYSGQGIAEAAPLPKVWRTILTRRLTVQGFIIFDHFDRYPAFLAEVAPMVADGRVRYRETVAEGLEAAPGAFMEMLKGGNFGKQLVRIGPDPLRAQVAGDLLTRMLGTEAVLTAAAGQVAEALAEPLSEARTVALRTLWSGIDRHRAEWSRDAQALRGGLATGDGDTPMQAAERRRLVVQAPARAAEWDRVADMVARQCDPASFPPLITERSEIVSGPDFGPVNYLMHLMSKLANPVAGDKTIIPETRHRDIPLSGAYFLNLLTLARRLLLAQGRVGPARFLDAGCGGGVKVLAASAMFEEARGIEISPEYVAEAQAFLRGSGADPAQIIAADALAFDGYGDFDVVYFYRPLKDTDLAGQMEARVMAQVRPGTVILAPLNTSLGLPENGAARVIHPVYIAGLSHAEVATIIARAEQIGCETRPDRSATPPDHGFWTPIVMRSQRNGFALGAAGP